MTLTELCQELKNWFDRGFPKWIGKITISGGNLECRGDGTWLSRENVALYDGQYFRIVGSVFNDGVYQFPCSTLQDESFDGAIWAMAVPPAVLALLDDINAWEAKYGGVDGALMSPFQSESFGGYSYSKGAIGKSSSGNGGDGATWQSMFDDRLKLWRKV